MTGIREETNIAELKADIYAIKRDPALYEEINFNSRIDAIDFIDFHVIDRIDGLLPGVAQPQALLALKLEAEACKLELEKINSSLFSRIRCEVRAGHYRGPSFMQLISQYFGSDIMLSLDEAEVGYDNLDFFINNLLSAEAVPDESIAREQGMVFFQKTPARIVFEMLERAQLTNKDVFFDLGAGLGQVCILASLLTKAAAIGVEYDPAYCVYANACAAGLQLKNVEFINIDAREADYTMGNVFFMYTPFEGAIMQEVLERLKEVSVVKAISIFTYGPCTDVIARQAWLQHMAYEPGNLYRLGWFRSVKP